ncbi:MAG: hypothetical protein R2701_13055 [Acidimicrobiales bacterium]
MGDGPRSASPVTVLVLTGTGWAARTLSVARQTVPDVSLLACRHVDELESIADRAPSPAAALLDGRHPEVDRDLVAGLADLGLGVVVVDQPDRHHRWRPLGATATVPTDASVEATLSAAVRAARGPIGLGGVPSSAIRTGAAPLVAVVGCADLAARVGADLAAELARRAADPAEVLLIDATRRSRLRSPLSLPATARACKTWRSPTTGGTPTPRSSPDRAGPARPATSCSPGCAHRRIGCCCGHGPPPPRSRRCAPPAA